jgi:dienelactone hydrolase
MAQLGEIPWSLSDLNKPTYRWLDASSQVRSLLLQGEPFQDHATEVFAYYATPGTLQHSQDAPASLPAILLLHDDGQMASSRWVQDSASRGYAAVALDLGGRGPDGTPLKLAGPADTPTIEKFARLEQDPRQHWPYHAVADTLLALSLLREFEEVHEDRLGTFGVGWGGILSLILACVDPRLTMAVSAFATAHLSDIPYWYKHYFQRLSEAEAERFRRLYDPSGYLPYCSTPLLLLQRGNDEVFPLSAFEHTCQDLPRAVWTSRILPEAERNAGTETWESDRSTEGLGEVYAFAEYYLNPPQPFPLPVLGKPLMELDREGVEQIFCTYRADVSISDAKLVYRTPEDRGDAQRWHEREARIGKETIVAAVPEHAEDAFFSVGTRDGLESSSEIVHPLR